MDDERDEQREDEAIEDLDLEDAEAEDVKGGSAPIIQKGSFKLPE